jgi:hypothetical protein
MHDELKDAVRQAHEQFEAAITAAREGGIVVNLWIYGSGPTGTGPSHVGFDFGQGDK